MQRIDKTQRIYAMARDNPAVARVQPGERLVFETCDCFGDQIERESTPFDGLDWNHINPATGPVWVEGAMPGDVLAVDIEDIRFGTQAVMVTAPGLGLLGERLSAPVIRTIPIDGGEALMPGGVRLPLNPMIGVIGTAPAGEPVSCGTPDAHGGNMDCRLISAGHTLYLPVAVEGALLALGDLHAAMGDGEVSVCGLEIAGEVQLRVRLIRQPGWPTPMIGTPTQVVTVGSAPTVDGAARLAGSQMLDFLRLGCDVPESDLLNLMSIGGQLQICQVVDPNKTCRFELPRRVLAQLGITFDEAAERRPEAVAA